MDQAINFDGNTSVYLQYSNVRLKTIIQKSKLGNAIDCLNVSKLVEDDEIHLLLKLDEFESVLDVAQKECEPCYVARYAIELATLVNKFYNNVRVISDDKDLTNARVLLCRIVCTVLEKSMNIMGIRTIDKM